MDESLRLMDAQEWAGLGTQQVLTVNDIISVHRQFHIEIFGFTLMQVIGKTNQVITPPGFKSNHCTR